MVKRDSKALRINLRSMPRKKREFQSMTEMLDFFKKTGAQGGKKRAAGMTEKERKASASKAASARWAAAKKKPAAASAKVRNAKAKAKKKEAK